MMARLVVITLTPVSLTATQCNAQHLPFFLRAQPFQQDIAHPCGIGCVDTESDCHDHRQGIHVRIIAIGQPDTSFRFARLQHSALVHGSDGGTKCRRITSNSVINSISFIHALAVSDGTAILPHPSIVIVVRFIGCTLYGETLAHFLFKGGNVIVKFCVRHFRINLCGGYLRMPQNLAHAFYRHTVIQCQNSEGVAAYME